MLMPTLSMKLVLRIDAMLNFIIFTAQLIHALKGDELDTISMGKQLAHFIAR